MRTLLLLLLFCHVSSPVLHSAKQFITASTGIQNLPEFVLTVEVDELLMGYCDSNDTLDVKQDIVKSFFEKNPEWLEKLELYKQRCFQVLPDSSQTFVHSLMTLYNQTGGVHVLQEVHGIEWDEETDEVKVFAQYGYDGEDFIKLDPNTFTWIAQRPEAVPITMMWDADKYSRNFFEIYVTQNYPKWLKMYLEYGWSFLLRTELPSVSLLQKTPSSPVSCLATGFYPHRASLVWRKDGEELHEEVDHGEILPNHDGTFQMSVDLKLSSVTPEDWTRYDCVFQLSGVNEDIITRLDKAEIRTNEGKTGIRSVDGTDNTTAIIAAVVVIALVLLAVAGVMAYRKRNAICTSSNDTESNKSEQSDPSEPEQEKTLLPNPSG